MAIKKPSPYIPSFLRSALSGSRPVQLTFSEVSDTHIQSTSSFMYDAPDAPLKSTQQLNVDWSKFENHTFFMSAETKVNLAFDQIINAYPFDGTRAEVETFFERLTGFDKWVFDQFPKFHGQLQFSGSYIVVKDSAGALYPELSKTKTGGSVITPNDGVSLSIEMMLFLPTVANNAQVVCQKLSGSNQGFSFHLLPTASVGTVEAQFSVVSGSNAMSVSALLNKGQFNHVCVTLNRELGTPYLEFFKSSQSVAQSKNRVFIGDMSIDATDFTIASGTAVTTRDVMVTPTELLSGTIDELRVFHSARTATQQAQSAPKSLFSTPDLKLYYRFNEPPPLLAASATDAVNSVVIDSSGNSLHALVTNFTGTLRQDASNDPLSLLIYEKEETTPVLFPAYQPVIDFNVELLASASAYDQVNPNLITRLVPQHYLLEGAAFEGFDNVEGLDNAPYGGSGIAGQGEMGNVQVMLSMLYIWARFFDEMKLFVDAFSTLRTVDYDSNSSMPNNFMYELVKQYGFNLPPLFNDSTIEQYIRAENIAADVSSEEVSLKEVQHELLRRVLVNLPDVMRSKGTQHSIKAFLRAVGIDPDNSVRLREYGGPTTKQLSFARETKREISTMIAFATGSLVVSPFLSASRREPGFPSIAGSFVKQAAFPPNGVSNNVNDGLLTSGSWTVESIVKYTPVNTKAMLSTTQSLARLCVTGSSSSSLGLVANLLVMSSSTDPKMVLYVRPGTEANSPTLAMQMSIPPGAVFNADRWNVSFGCQRNDEIGSRVSSSYFMRLATQNNGDITYFQTTSSFFNEVAASEANAFRTKTATTASLSGAYLAVGENQLVPSGAGNGYLFLNNVLRAPDEARTTHFSGMVSNQRFWSEALAEDEWTEHVRNYKSLGVADPLVGYNFVRTRSGSFGKVRLDSLGKQDVRRANATASLGPLGSITFLDFSLNGMHLTGSGFPTDVDCARGEIFDHSYLSPYFDEASTNEKVRIRSYQDQDLIDATPWASTAPVYEIVRSEQPTDDTRFSIDFSLIDALNRDIVTLFSTFDAIDNALGSPELVFSPDYPDLERLRNVYFNRISTKLNFKAFFEFYRWFDTSIGVFIEQLVPRKTRFKGTNFVIESHMLERHKLEYLSSEMYLHEEDRSRLSDSLALLFFEALVRKY